MLLNGGCVVYSAAAWEFVRGGNAQQRVESCVSAIEQRVMPYTDGVARQVLEKWVEKVRQQYEWNGLVYCSRYVREDGNNSAVFDLEAKTSPRGMLGAIVSIGSLNDIEPGAWHLLTRSLPDDWPDPWEWRLRKV